jgi:hypothetical protein
VAGSTVKAMTSPCAAFSRSVGGGSSGFWEAGGGGWGGGRQSVGGSCRLAARATAACSLMMDVARGSRAMEAPPRSMSIMARVPSR